MSTTAVRWVSRICPQHPGDGTPTLFIDGVVHRGGFGPPTLLAALAP